MTDRTAEPAAEWQDRLAAAPENDDVRGLGEAEDDEEFDDEDLDEADEDEEDDDTGR